MKGIFFIAGILLSVLKWKKVIDLGLSWIILCFIVWLLLIYLSIHKKNRDVNTPRPVYITQ